MDKNTPSSNNSSSENQNAGQKKRPKLIQKILRGFFLIVLCLGIGIYLLLYFFLNPYLKKQIVQTVYQSSDQLYLLDIEDLDISLFYGHINIDNVYLRVNPEEASQRQAKRVKGNYLDLEIKVGDLSVEGIHWLKYLFTKRLHIEKILLAQPDIYSLNQRLSPRKQAANELSTELVSIFSQFCKELILDDFSIIESKVNIEARRSKEVILHEAQKFGVQVTDLHIHANPDASALSNIKFGMVQFESASYRFYSTDGAYQFQFDSLSVSTEDSIFRLGNFEVLPRDSNTVDFLAKKNTKVQVNVKEVKVEGLDFKRLIYLQEIALNHLLVNQLKMDIEQIPSREKKKNINEVVSSKKRQAPDPYAFKKALLDIPLYIQMDSVHVANASFFIKSINPQNPSDILSYHQLDTVSLQFKNLSLGKAIDTTQKLPLNARDVELEIKNYRHLSPDGMAELFIQEARVSAQDSIIQIRNAYVKPLISLEAFSAQKPFQQLVVEGSVALLQAKQLDFERMAFLQEFSLGRIDLKAPKFKAYSDKRKPKKTTQKYRNFEELLRSIPLFIEVDTFTMVDASFEYAEQRNSKNNEVQLARHQAQGINLQITDAEFGSAYDESAFQDIHTKSLILGLDNYQYDTPNGDYQLGIRRIDISSKTQAIELEAFQLIPTRSLEDFARRKKHRYSLANIQVDKIIGGEVDFKRLLLMQEIDWGYVKLINPKLDIYADARKARRPRPKKAPKTEEPSSPLLSTLSTKGQLQRNRNLTDTSGLRQTLRDIPVYIKVDTFQVKNARITYRQQNNSTMGKGLATHLVDNIHCIVPQIRLGKATKDPGFEHFYSGNILFTLKNYQFRDAKDEFTCTLKDIQSSLKDSLLQIQSISYKPLKSQEKFNANREHQGLYVDLELSSIQSNAIDLDRLIFDQEIVLKELYIKEPKINLFVDARKSKKPKPLSKAKTLDEILASLPIHIEMDTFAIVDAFLEYNALSALKNSSEFGLARHRVEKFNLAARDMALGLSAYSTRTNKADRLLYSEDLRLSLDNYTFQMPNQEYILAVEHLETSKSDTLVSIQNIHYGSQLNPEAFDSLHALRKARLDIRAKELRARPADLREVLNNQRYHLQSLAIQDIDLNIYQNMTKPKDTSRKPLDMDEILAKLPYEFQIDQLSLNNARLNYLTKKKNKQGVIHKNSQSFDSLYLVLNQFHLDPKQRSNDFRLLFSDNLNLRLANYQTFSADSLYKIGCKSLSLNTADSSLSIQGFGVNTTVSDSIFNTYQRFETDLFNINAKSIEGQAIDFIQFVNNKEVRMGSLAVNELEANIYRDKRLEDDPNHRPTMPHIAFKKINLPMQIDTIQINNSQVNYKEKVPKGIGTGEVFFNELNLNILNLNTNKEQMDTTLLSLQGRLMGEGLLTLDLKIPLKADSLSCAFEGSLSQMDASFFNQFVEANQHMKIKDGYIHKIAYQASIENTSTNGRMNAGFKGLKIQFLKKKDHEKTKGALSFLANVVIHNNGDSRRKKSKSSRIKYEADQQDGFVKILWKSLASGLVRALL